MEFIFCMQINIKFLQVNIIIFYGSGQACPKYTKLEVGNIFAIYSEKKYHNCFYVLL